MEFARELSSLGAEIVSTGGTAKLLRDSGVAVRDISDLTGWPEMLGGRVKTLHPKVHGGILYQRSKTEDQKQTQEHGIVPIDLVVVNLYPFSATAATPASPLPNSSKISTSAAPPWFAPPRKIFRASAWSPIMPITRPSLPNFAKTAA